MALEFNPKALSAFSNVNLGKNDAIANLDKDGGLVKKGTRGLGIFSKIRFKSTEARNNAVRTEFLKALGQAFSINGVSEQGNKTHFSAEFMNKLEELLGPAFKRGDFGIDKNGVVSSGKPLTQRRITAIFKAAALAKVDSTEYDGKAYLAKVDAITDWFKKERLPDAHSTVFGLKFFTDLRKAINYLESDLEGFTEAYEKRGAKGIQSFIINKTKMSVFIDDIVRDIEEQKKLRKQEVQNEEPTVIINIDDINEELEAVNRANKANPDYVEPETDAVKVKKYVKQKLEAMVKMVVDTCLELKDTDKFEDFMEIIYNEGSVANSTLTALEKFRQEQL